MDLTARLVAADGGMSTLVGKADVVVAGKFAQFGGRMMNSVSDMILAQFADTFSQKAAALQAASAAEAAAAPAPAPVTAPKELNALTIVWALVRRFFASLFGRKT